jgi:hypothetical protein
MRVRSWKKYSPLTLVCLIAIAFILGSCSRHSTIGSRVSEPQDDYSRSLAANFNVAQSLYYGGGPTRLRITSTRKALPNEKIIQPVAAKAIDAGAAVPPVYFGCAKTYTMAWDPNTEPDIVDYEFCVTNADTHELTSCKSVGNTTTTDITLNPGNYTLTVRAKNSAGLESLPSNEVNVTVTCPQFPPGDPNNQYRTYEQTLVEAGLCPRQNVILQQSSDLKNWMNTSIKTVTPVNIVVPVILAPGVAQGFFRFAPADGSFLKTPPCDEPPKPSADNNIYTKPIAIVITGSSSSTTSSIASSQSSSNSTPAVVSSGSSSSASSKASTGSSSSTSSI